jgi:hypothetical protein
MDPIIPPDVFKCSSDDGETIPENKKTIVKVIYDNDVSITYVTGEPDKLERDFYNQGRLV